MIRLGDIAEVSLKPVTPVEEIILIDGKQTIMVAISGTMSQRVNDYVNQADSVVEKLKFISFDDDKNIPSSEKNTEKNVTNKKYQNNCILKQKKLKQKELEQKELEQKELKKFDVDFKLINEISNWSQEQKIQLTKDVKSILDYNCKHFDTMKHQELEHFKEQYGN